MALQIVLDALLFKLAFHTYEALRNKEKLIRRKKADADEASSVGGASRTQATSNAGDPLADLDLISNRSDESTMTMGGPAPQRERKIERYDESLDVKLNQYLMKWIVIIIFYQTSYVWNLLGYALPAMPAVRLGLGCWIMLPQLKGEFYLYHMLLDHILVAERKLLSYRCEVCSSLVGFFTSLALGCLKFAVTYVSEECIVKSQEAAQQTRDVLRQEIQDRCETQADPTKRRDTFIRKHESGQKKMQRQPLDAYGGEPQVSSFGHLPRTQSNNNMLQARSRNVREYDEGIRDGGGIQAAQYLDSAEFDERSVQSLRNQPQGYFERQGAQHADRSARGPRTGGEFRQFDPNMTQQIPAAQLMTPAEERQYRLQQQHRRVDSYSGGGGGVMSQSHATFSPDAPVFSDQGHGGGRVDYDIDEFGNEYDDVDIRRVGTQVANDRDAFYAGSDVGSRDPGLNQSMALPLNSNTSMTSKPTRQPISSHAQQNFAGEGIQADKKIGSTSGAQSARGKKPVTTTGRVAPAATSTVKKPSTASKTASAIKK